MPTTQEQLPILADRLGYANVLIKQLRKEVRELRVERGKDAAYIEELKHANAKLLQQLANMKKLTPAQRVELFPDDALAGKTNKQLKRDRDGLLKQIMELKERLALYEG